MFFLGFTLGITFTIFIGFLFILYVKRQQNIMIKKEEAERVNIDKDAISTLLSEKKEAVLKNKGVGFNSNLDKIKEGITEISEFIPKTYFPNSKYPKYELTIEETLLLNIHISERLLEQLNRKRFVLLKELRISQILYLNDLKNNIKEKKFIKSLSKYKIVDIIKNGWMIYNIANPLYWVRKLAITGGIETAMRSFGVVILDIINDELNSVYSKSFKDAEASFNKTKLLEMKKKELED